MASRGYGYQYETSPRKIEPEYQKTSIKKKKAVTKKPVKAKKKTNKKKAKAKQKISFEMKFFINSMTIFIAVFAVIACQTMVEQRYKEKESLKKEYDELVSNMSVGSDSEEDVRILASEYGMQTKSATLIDLGTTDYIESSNNEVKIDEETWLQKVEKWISELF